MECQTLVYLHKQDISVPCMKCPFCLATKRSDWMQRIMQEWKKGEPTAFITLTYANPHLTYRDGKSQLVKRDLQLYFKRLRKSIGKAKFRYYAVGEYGSRTKRPHYHIIGFGNVNENQYRDAWPFGLAHIGKLTLASCGYVTKYVIESKPNGIETIDNGDEKSNILPLGKMINGRAVPFSVMSRRPGLGSNYLTKSMIEWHLSNDYHNYMIAIDGSKRHLPRYYRDKIFTKAQKRFIGKFATLQSIETERKILYDLWKHSKQEDAQAYREEQLKELAIRIRSKSLTNNLNSIYEQV